MLVHPGGQSSLWRIFPKSSLAVAMAFALPLAGLVSFLRFGPLVAPAPSLAPAHSPDFGALTSAFEHGVINGYSDGTFRPGNNATRGQICKIVYEAVTAP